MALIDDAFAGLSDLRAAFAGCERVGCHIFISSPPTRERRESWLKIAMDGTVADQLAEAARNSLLRLEARAADDQALAEFDFDAMADGSIGTLRVADVPAIADWLDEVPSDDWTVRFDGDERALDRARFYATRLNFGDGRSVVLFRGSRGLSVTLKEKGAIAAAFSQERHQMIAIEGSVVTFDGLVDFFAWEGLIYISNLMTFESVTNIRAVTVRKANEALDAIDARFPLGSNTAELKAEISKRTRLAKKLAAAHQHGLIDDIDPQNLANRAVDRNLRFRCSMMGGNVQFDIDPHNRGEVEDFVDLVTDLFLHSPVTNREWEAVVKRVPRTRQ